jgi:hypothetical protein
MVAAFLTSCSHGEGDSSQILGKEEIIRAFPQFGEVSDAKHGREVWFAYGPLSGVQGTPANGVADAHFLEDGTFILGVQLNIALAPDNTFYEVWIRNPETD